MSVIGPRPLLVEYLPYYTIREQGIPFEITRETLNGEILAAFKEVEEMKKNSTLARCYTA